MISLNLVVLPVKHRRISLLSIKLAQIQRSSGTVISVHTETTSIGSHSDLITMFGLGNRNIVCLNKVMLLFMSV